MTGLLIDRTKGKGMNYTGDSWVEAVNMRYLVAAAPPSRVTRPPGNTMEDTVSETVPGLIRNARNTPHPRPPS